MGRTLADWKAQVQKICVDHAGRDVDDSAALVGIQSALGIYAIDRPRMLVVEVAGDGTAYLSLPAAVDGWEQGFSRIVDVEYPARLNPPALVDRQSWTLTRSPSDGTLERIALADAAPSASEYVRLWFTGSWPTPTTDATADKVDAVAFNAVTHLAASFALAHLANQAARNRSGALANTFVDGEQRARTLTERAAALRTVYDTFLGRTAADGGTVRTAPVSRTFDFDPGYLSIFHGRRR